jgi:amidase
MAGAAEQARLVATGEVSARELVEATLRRIDDVDPLLHAYRVVLAEQALERATELDRVPQEARGVLHGVPVAVKDDTNVADTTTTFGTAAHGPPVGVDAVVVARLRAAGGVIVGKTSVPEMDAWPWTTSATWGTTANPWALERTPGGSSGGSAAAAASGMCGVALGSDGGGSVRYPGALCGVFGLKAQRGRIPLDGAGGAGWHGLVAYGSLARHVADAATFLDATSNDAPSQEVSAGLCPRRSGRCRWPFRSNLLRGLWCASAASAGTPSSGWPSYSHPSVNTSSSVSWVVDGERWRT